MEEVDVARRPLLLLRWKCAVLTILNMLASAALFLGVYPRKGAYVGGGLCVVSAASLFLRLGWIVPCMIAGVYFGMCCLDPLIKGGDHESQMWETVGAIVRGTLYGLVLGVVLDLRQRQSP